MKKIILSLVLLANILTSCSTTKNAMGSNTASMASHPQDGLSYETAIVINKKNESEGVDAEYKWIKAHYSNYQIKGQALNTFEKRAHDVITIELADGKKVELYFDISKFFGKM
jgi:isopentenyldiphosphate isomerase